MPSSLGARLNLFLFAFLAGLGVLCGLVVFAGYRNSEKNANQAARQGIEDYGESTLGVFANFAAQSSDLSFVPIEQVSRAGASLMARSSSSRVSTNGVEETLVQHESGAWYNDDPDRLSDLWLSSSREPSNVVARDIEQSAALDLLIPAELENTSVLISAFYIGASGLTRHYPPIGLHDELDPSTEFSNELVMELAGPNANGIRRTVWSPVYDDPAGRGQLISVATPVWAGDRFVGIVGAEIALSQLVFGVDSTRPSENGFAFVLQPGGDLLPSQSSARIDAALQDPANLALGRLIAAMRAGQSGTERLTIDGQEVVVGYSPLLSLGGSLALVAPVEDVAREAGVERVSAAISTDGQRTLWFIGFTSIGLFIVALGVVWWLNRRFILRPIGALVEATRAVGEGDLAVSIPVRRRDELGQLASAFNDMTGMLASRDVELRRETMERELAQQELNALFGAMSDVVVVLDAEGTYIRVAPVHPELLQRPVEELIGHNIREFFPPEQGEQFVDCIRRALDQQETQTIEYRLPSSDDWFLGAVSPMGEDRVVWVGRDITERVNARRLLEQRVEERTRELSTLVRASRNIASRIELGPLMSVLLNQLHSVIAYDGAAAVVIEDDEMVFLDSRGLGEREDQIIGLRMNASRWGLIWDRLIAGENVIVGDIDGGTPEAQALVQAVGARLKSQIGYVRSWMAIPMRSRDRIVGVLSVSRNEADYFQEKDADLVSAFANFAAIAIDNARLFEEAQRRVRQNTALARIARAGELGVSVQTMLERIAADTVDAIGFVGCSIIVGDERQPFFRTAGQSGLPAGYIPGMVESWQRGASLVDLSQMLDMEPVVIRDAWGTMRNDARFASIHPALDETEFGQAVIVPIEINGRLGGSINVYAQHGREATPEELDFLKAMAGQLSILLTNAALYSQSEQRARDLEVILTAADRLSSTLELEPLVDIALDQLSLIAPHEGEGVYLVDDGKVLMYQRRQGQSSATLQESELSVAGELFEHLMEGQVLVIDDVLAEGRYPAMWREAIRIHGMDRIAEPIRSFLGVPLVVTGRVIGAIMLAADKPARFDQRHRRLAQGVAYQMAVAFENARLFSETLERERENRALASVSSALALDEPFEATLRSIARAVVDTTSAGGCSLTLIGPDGSYAQGGNWGLPERFQSEMEGAVNAGAPSPAHAVVRSGRGLVISGLQNNARLDPRTAGVALLLEGSNYDNAALVPLFYRGRVIGTMSTFYAPSVVPTQDDLALLSAIANQASFAVENARLFTETTKRERETRALATVASAVAFDQTLQETLNDIARGIVDTTDAVGCTLSLIEPEGNYSMSGVHGMPPGFDEAYVRSVEAGAHSAPFEVMRTGVPQIHSNLKQWFLTHSAFSLVAPLVQDITWDNAAVVPLKHRGRTLGALTTYYEPEVMPGNEDIAVLSAIAAQASVAVENARLFSDVEQNASEMAALYRADEALHRSLDLQHVFDALVDVAVEVLNADRSALFRWESRTGLFDLQAMRGFSEEAAEQVRSLSLRAGGTMSEAVHTGEVVAVEDASVGPVVNRGIPLREGVRSFMHVPIKIGNEVFGSFFVAYLHPHVFTEGEKRLGTALSQRASVAIQNARLYEQAQQAASLEERQRIARDLHDSVSQALFGIGLGAKTAVTLLDRDPQQARQPLDYIISLSEAGLAELRALIFELRPDSIATDGLIAAIERQVAATRARHQLQVEAHLIGEPEVSLDVKEALYRVAQEAMTNAVKHARATTLHLNLERANGNISLIVADDGIGFDTHGEFPGHMGLKSMKERAEKLGGTLTLESAPGAGTRVDIVLPA